MVRRSNARMAAAAGDGSVPPAAEAYRAPAVANAAQLLQAFSADAAELSLSELSQRSGLGKSTVHRLIATLRPLGCLEHNPLTGKYRLGLKLFELGSIVAGRMAVRVAARPHLEALRDQVDETALLGVLHRGTLLYVAKAESYQAVSLSAEVGQRAPAHSTAMGKVLLAHAPEEVVAAVLAEPLPAFTPRTLTEPAALRAELARSRAAGYAVSDEESERGLVGVAAAVLVQGTAVAAVGVGGPAARFAGRERARVATLVRAAAARIAEDLQNAPPAVPTDEQAAN